MTITYTIAQLDRSLPDGTVVTAHWRVTAEDQGFTASTYGTQSFARDEEAEGFVPYADLTEAMIIGWVQDAMGTEQVAAIEAALAASITAQANPVTATGTPW